MMDDQNAGFAQQQAPAGGGQMLQPHRGAVVLVLGILGIVVCFICGIIAWSMGSKDLREIDAGRMDPSGRGLTQAGKICGIIGSILGALWFVWVLFVVVLGAAGAASQGMR